MISDGKTVVIGGQARLPKELYPEGVFQVVAEINPETGKILDAEFSPSGQVISKVLREWLIGASLPDGLESVLEVIEQRFFHKGKKAVLTAVKDLGREFREYKNNRP